MTLSLESITAGEAPQGMGSDYKNLPSTAHTDTVAFIYKMEFNLANYISVKHCHIFSFVYFDSSLG